MVLESGNAFCSVETQYIYGEVPGIYHIRLEFLW